MSQKVYGGRKHNDTHCSCEHEARKENTRLRIVHPQAFGDIVLESYEQRNKRSVDRQTQNSN